MACRLSTSIGLLLLWSCCSRSRAQEDTVTACSLQCQNGGSCEPGELPLERLSPISYLNYYPPKFDQMHCACLDTYDGELCDVERTPCGDHYCFHGGTCVTRDVNGATVNHCDCSTASTEFLDYAGRFCQFKATSYCSKNTGLNGHLFCTNFGTCQDDAHMGCVCPDQFAGFSCEFVKAEFATSLTGTGSATESPAAEDVNGDGVADPLPVDPTSVMTCDLDCQNQGVCRNGVKDLSNLTFLDNFDELGMNDTDNFMHCVCPDGFTGVYCDDKVQVCSEGTHLCLHGSKCVAEGDEQSCDCTDANTNASETGTLYTGTSCERPVNDICTIDRPGPGQPLYFCVNSGKCKSYVEFGQPHPGCLCVDGFTGPHCELTRSPPQQPVATEPIRDQNTVQTTSSNSSSSSGESHRVAGRVVGLLLVAMTAIAAMYFAAVYFKRKPVELRRRRRRNDVAENIRWATEYQDRPQELNLAPLRRDSTAVDYQDYPVNSHASSTDPFATHLAPKRSEEPSPQIYIGPPRDEDGHELHNVDII